MQRALRLQPEKTMILRRIFMTMLAVLATVPAWAQWNQGGSQQYGLGGYDPLYTPISWRTIAQAHEATFTSSGAWVIVDQGSWERFYSNLRNVRNLTGGHYNQSGFNQNGFDRRAPEVADWSREQILVLYLGRQPIGTMISVSEIRWSSPHTWDVFYTIRQGQMAPINRPEAWVSPYVIVRMNRMPGVPNFYQTGINGYGYGQRPGCSCQQQRCNSCGCGCHRQQSGGGNYLLTPRGPIPLNGTAGQCGG